jgi:hypothetical protein
MFLFLPVFPVTVVPGINLIALDESGNRLANIRIEQTWRHYTFQYSDSIEEVVTDMNGVATFPRRVEYFSVVQLSFGLLIEFININPHASFGPSSYFLPRGNLSGSAIYRPDQPLPTEIVVKH